MAQFAEASYLYNKKNLNKQQRIDRINDKFSEEGYQIHPSSNRDVQLYTKDDYNGDGGRHVVIAHRGTDFSGRSIAKDIKADLSYILGKEDEWTKAFKQRDRKTDSIMKDAKVTDDDHVTLVGHSLGGASAYHTILRNPKIRDKIDNVELYNPLTHNVKQVKLNTGNDIKELAEKQVNKLITTHRTSNDIASIIKQDYGKVKNYKQKYHAKKFNPSFQKIFDKAEQLSAHTIKNFT
jgi:alpha-beta hydrolase superfamily lysophospholipase